MYIEFVEVRQEKLEVVSVGTYMYNVDVGILALKLLATLLITIYFLYKTIYR